MNPTTAEPSSVLRVEGTIQQIDPSSRVLELLVNGALQELVVPPDSVIRLNGERVKLRLLQAGDRAEVGYSLVGGMAFAHAIQVRWLHRVIAAAKAETREGSLALPESTRFPDARDRGP